MEKITSSAIFAWLNLVNDFSGKRFLRFQAGGRGLKVKLVVG